jgi:hypothetical protein
VFDFMNLVLPLRRLIDRGSKQGRDEPEFGDHAGHRAETLTEEALTVDARTSSTLPTRGEMVMARETITTA